MTFVRSREQRRVALDVSCRGPRRGRVLRPARRGRRRARPSGLTLPSRLSSRLVTVQHGASRLRHLPGDRHGRRGRASGRSCRRSPSAHSAPATSRSTSRTAFLFPASTPFLLVMVVGASSWPSLERRLRSAAARAGRGRARGRWPSRSSARRAAVRRLAVPGRLRHLARLDRRRDLRRRSGSSPRARCWPASGPAWTSEAAAALPLFAEAAALLAAVLSVLLPPVGRDRRCCLLLWLLFAGRSRGEQKYAGLRILR